MAQFQIFFKTLDGKTKGLDISSTDTISDIKNKIQEKEGIPREHVWISYDGKRLDDEYPAKYYGIQKETMLHLSLRVTSQMLVILMLPTTEIIETKPDKTLKQMISDNILPIHTKILHKNHVLDKSLTVKDIFYMYNTKKLHTRTRVGVPVNEAHSIQFKIIYNNQCIRSSSIKNTLKQTQYDKHKALNELICNYFRRIGCSVQFLSEYCPFKAISIQYINEKISLKLKGYSPEHITLFHSSYGFEDNFGLIPQNTLQSLTRCFSSCDCCRNVPKSQFLKTVSAICVDGEYPIIIEIVLSEIPFYFDNQYYVSGRFYNLYKYDDMKNRINLQFYPLLRDPMRLNKHLLITGFVENNYNGMVPIDIINEINKLYPMLYGGIYDVNADNPGLVNKLQQKTKTFDIGGIKFHLICTNKGKRLSIDASNIKNMKFMAILYSYHCKLTKQSYSRLFKITRNTKATRLKMCDFGDASNLSSLSCKIQIVNITTERNEIYNYPLQLTQNGYLLEWNIDGELMKSFKKCIDKKSVEYFQSMIFYELFLIRCFPNGGYNGNNKGKMCVEIQLITLPRNVKELRTKCKISEIETNSSTDKFTHSFNYQRRYNRTITKSLTLSSSITNKSKLTIRAEIADLILVPTKVNHLSSS